jgi:hypothetical protein
MSKDFAVSGNNELAEAIGRQRKRSEASMSLDRTGWTDAQWVADAERLMYEPDGAITSLLNGHVTALLRTVDHYRTSFRNLRDAQAEHNTDCWCGHPASDHKPDPVRDYRELACEGCGA